MPRQTNKCIYQNNYFIFGLNFDSALCIGTISLRVRVQWKNSICFFVLLDSDKTINQMSCRNRMQMGIGFDKQLLLVLFDAEAT